MDYSSACGGYEFSKLSEKTGELFDVKGPKLKACVFQVYKFTKVRRFEYSRTSLHRTTRISAQRREFHTAQTSSNLDRITKHSNSVWAQYRRLCTFTLLKHQTWLLWCLKWWFLLEMEAILNLFSYNDGPIQNGFTWSYVPFTLQHILTTILTVIFLNYVSIMWKELYTSRKLMGIESMFNTFRHKVLHILVVKLFVKV